MPKTYVTILGKSVRYFAKLRGGGSALPGLWVERIDPDFLKRTLSQLPKGVVVVSGTNGKTTTTKMIVELLESQGLKVFTNRSGSNFTRGVSAALIGDINIKGNLNADIAVLELDEAHAVHFVKAIAPSYCLLLNVMRDQLDRFGEIDMTAKLLLNVAKHTTKEIVLNREDPLINELSVDLDHKKISYFGLDRSLRHLFSNDNELYGKKTLDQAITKQATTLDYIDNHSAKFSINNKTINTELKLRGIYNIFNAAAALALVKAVLGNNIDYKSLSDCLSKIEPAFGRGETIIVKGQPIELVLVKNPSGFRLGLSSFSAKGYATMIAINDNYADGRDMSWLWDVDFSSLKIDGVSSVSGSRAYDIALRLRYDEIKVGLVEISLSKALKKFITENKNRPKRIYCTYTAMLTIRKKKKKITKLEAVS
mgnify:CR=1 FL=1